MKDLQDLFESLDGKEFNTLVEIMDKKDVTDLELDYVWQLIISTYNAELRTYTDTDDLSDELVDILYDRFKKSLIVFIGIQEGYFLGEGRISLTKSGFRFSKNPNWKEN